MATYQYIYVMKGLGQSYPGGREVLKDIWLSFLPGAKIGILGPNGAGKSTLLRIMAGDEGDFAGEAWAAEGARVGYLPQEPALDSTKDVFGNVIEGLSATKALLDPVVTVTHDRYFLDEVAGWILELDRGRGIPYEGNYSGWLEQKQQRLEQEGRQEAARQRTLERELEWVRQSPRARQAKSRARLSAYESLVAQSREKAPETAQIVLPPGPRLGELVIDAH